MKKMLLLLFCFFLPAFAVAETSATLIEQRIDTATGYRVEIMRNILLLVPLGALACSLWPRPLSLLVVVVLSVLIEAAQLVFYLGLCELDDIVSNGLGGCIGWALGWGGKKM